MSQIPYYEGVPLLRHFRSGPAPIGAGVGTSDGTFMLAPFDVEGEPLAGNIVASSFAIFVSGNLTATSVSQQLSSSIFVGIYTRTGSTLSIVNSASATFGNTNASTANTSRWNGVRAITIASSAWSTPPIFGAGNNYWIGVFVRSHSTTGAMSWMLAFSVNTVYSGIQGAGAPANSVQAHGNFIGRMSVSTSAIPASVQASAMIGTGAAQSFRPFFRLDSDLAIY